MGLIFPDSRFQHLPSATVADGPETVPGECDLGLLSVLAVKAVKGFVFVATDLGEIAFIDHDDPL